MDDLGLLCLGTLILVAVVAVVSANSRAKRLQAAREAYEKSLQKLRENPGSSKQREATLNAGRAYARVARETKRETLFDEVALLNDISAIAGQQITPPIAGVSQPSQVSSIEERLTKLQKLAEAGHITEEEYSERRKRLLDEI